MTNVLTRAPLLKPTNLEVRAEGELVCIKIGRDELRMHYEDAFKISQFIRVRAKQAKRSCGDTRRHWSSVAVLDGLMPDKELAEANAMFKV